MGKRASRAGANKSKAKVIFNKLQIKKTTLYMLSEVDPETVAVTWPHLFSGHIAKAANRDFFKSLKVRIPTPSPLC